MFVKCVPVTWLIKSIFHKEKVRMLILTMLITCQRPQTDTNRLVREVFGCCGFTCQTTRPTQRSQALTVNSDTQDSLCTAGQKTHHQKKKRNSTLNFIQSSFISYRDKEIYLKTNRKVCATATVQRERDCF